MITLGIDIGGSAVKGALINTETGELVSERIRYGNRSVLEPAEIIHTIEKIRSELNYQGIIGAGFPGIVKNGVILTSANLHPEWVNANLAQMITKATHQPAVSINDADAAGLAEMRFGVKAAREKKVVLFLTIGTGIGSALFLNGQLLPNTELGHLKIRGRDAEQRASAAIKRIEKLSWKKWGERLNEALETYEFLLSPDLFILGGGISAKFDSFSRYLKVSTPVVPAKLQNLAGIIGAAMAAAEANPQQV